MVQPADRGMISWIKARMRYYYSEHFMTFVLAELRKGKSATQIKIDVTAPSMKTLLAVTFAKALSELPEEKVRKCWFGLQKAFPSDNPDHATLLRRPRRTARASSPRAASTATRAAAQRRRRVRRCQTPTKAPRSRHGRARR